MESVPVIEVDASNFSQLWPDIVSAIKSATFIAIDNELSGLGSRRLINAKSIEERYKAICEVARTRSIVSTGISCYRLLPGEDPQESGSCGAEGDVSAARCLRFSVQTFSLFVLCQDHYMVEPASLRFLVEHGFDFNRQYSAGLPYSNDHSKGKMGDLSQPSLQSLYGHLIASRRPLVLHNGLVDLIYLYQSLHAPTPPGLPSFLADLAAMHPTGLYDTKYIAEFKARLSASYLQYVFRKCQKDNQEAGEKSWSHITTTFPGEHAEHTIQLPCGLLAQDTVYQGDVCLQYANHGWCAAAAKCPKSHNIDHILSTEGQQSSRKRRKRNKKAAEAPSGMSGEGPGESDMDTHADETADNDNPSANDNNGSLHVQSATNVSSSRVEGHRAGFDAFMTGYSFAFFISRFGKSDTGDGSASGCCVGGEEFADKIYLGGKDIPLQIVKSVFAKNSKDHMERMAFLTKAVPPRD